MITTAILYVIYGLVWLVASPILLVSDVSADSAFGSAINSAGLYLSPVDVVFPVASLVAVVGIFTAYEAGYFAYKLVMWVIRRFPTQS